MNEYEMQDYDDTLVITNTRRKQLEEEALAHHGILGMKWGIRRYQNEDGSLTELGQRHYDMLERKQELEYDRRNRKEEADVERERLRYQRETDKQNLSNQKKADKDKYWLQRDQRVDDFVNNERERKHARKQFVTALAVGAVAVGGGIALHHYLKKKGQEAIDSPKLTDAITAGSEKVEDIMKGAPLTFGSKSNKVSFANKYDFGNTANRGNNTKSTFTFGEMLLDDVKKDIKSKKGFSIDHDDAERLRDFASSAPFREAQRGIANRRTKTIAQNIAAHEKAKKLDDAVNDTVTRIGSGRFGNPTAMMPTQKWTTPSWSNVNDPNRYTKTAVSNLAGNLISPKSSSSPLSFGTNSILGGGTSKSTSTVNPADLLARKAAYDTSVSNLGSNLDKTLKKFKHSNIGDAYDMTDSKLMHTAMAISSRRRAQLENRDDYLMHDGRKGMKWGKNIFTEDELNKSQSRSVDPNQYAQQLLAEANRRKQNHQNTSLPGYGDGVPLTRNTSNPGYGDGTPLTQNTSLPGYGDGVLLNTEKKSTAKVEPRQKHDPTINVRGKQVSTEDIEKQKNKSDMEDLAQDTAQTIDNINKGNTGNNVVDQLINAKTNRYKMMYDMVVPKKETNKTENRRLDTANSEPHLKRDPTKNDEEKQASTENIENQKNKSDMEDLAQDTAQTIDNINKGNTGNNVVDQLINAKTNRYKMMYDMVVPKKETNKTENRRLDTANESNSSPDKLKKKLKV